MVEEMNSNIALISILLTFLVIGMLIALYIFVNCQLNKTTKNINELYMHQQPNVFSVEENTLFQHRFNNRRANMINRQNLSNDLQETSIVSLRSASQPHHRSIFLQDMDLNNTVFSSITGKSYKTTLNNSEKQRYSKIKSKFSVNSSNLSFLCETINEVIRNSIDSEEDLIYSILLKVLPYIQNKITIEQITSKQFKIFNVINLSKDKFDDYLFTLMSNLNQWFYRKIKSFEIGTRCLFLSLLYLEKLLLRQDFTLTMLNVYRIFATLFLISAKFTEDQPITNKYWADVCNISKSTMDKLEIALCVAVNFDFSFEVVELTRLFKLFDVSEYQRDSRFVENI